MMKSLFTLFFFIYSSLYGSPIWMKTQIEEDLSHFRKDGYCPKCLMRFFQNKQDEYQLCVFVVRENHLYWKTANSIPTSHDRFQQIMSALRELTKRFRLPNVTFLVSLHDAVNEPCSVPIFVMSKQSGDQKILIPDFEALAGRYQVIQGIDLETELFQIPWKDRKERLIWRGSGSQGMITKENMHTKNRAILCQLGMDYPEMIDAGFSALIPSCLEKYRKNYLPFEEIFAHKYQIWLDGNAASYSNSGWRLYSGSTVIKPNSPYTQWYYGALIPWVHYVPVKENLEDLIETLVLLKENATFAEEIAENGTQFAREHISKEQNLLYLHDLLWAYHSIPICVHQNCP